MSTKKIREALEALASFDGVDGDPMTLLSDPAMRELEAIERAAKVLDDDEVRRALRHAPSEVHDAMNLLESIAKDAP